jgi:hypothetical protein
VSDNDGSMADGREVDDGNEHGDGWYGMIDHCCGIDDQG